MGGGASTEKDETYEGVTDFLEGSRNKKGAQRQRTPKTTSMSEKGTFARAKDTTAFAQSMGFDLQEITNEAERVTVGRFLAKLHDDPDLVAWVANKRDKVDGSGINLTTYHLTKVVQSLTAQEELPEGVIGVLENFIDSKISFEDPSKIFDFEARIRFVSDGCAKTLPRKARRNEQIRHDLAHALKLEEDVMRFDSVDDTSPGRLVRSLKSCDIRLHDEKQKNKEKGTSNEEITAHDVTHWQVEALEVPEENHAVRHIIKFLAERIIVCGTTLLWGKNERNPKKPKNTNMDLLEFLLVLEKSALKAGHRTCSESNQAFVNAAYITTTLTAIFDKVEIASKRRCDDNPVTFAAMKAYLGRDESQPLMFERFVSMEQPVPYHHITSEGILDEASSFGLLDEKTLLMGLVPNVTMATESAYFDPDLQGVNITPQWEKESTFLNRCHQHYSPEPTSEFTRIFNQAFQGVAPVMHALFFERIHKEQAFMLSQVEVLTVLRDALLELGMPAAKVREIVNPEVPKAHAENLGKLKDFYDTLETEEEKTALAEELGMVLVLQKGAQLVFNLRASIDRRKDLEKAMSEASLRVSALTF
jgi:hypothetical protein